MTMKRFRLSRRAALGLAVGGSVLTRLPGWTASAQILDKVSYQTSWRAQAEHGGFYQAVATGIYKKYGIDCDLRMGGPQVSVSQLLMGGSVDLVMSSGLEALNYAREDLPFFCVASIFQKSPDVLIAHAGSGNDSFEKLKGKTILIGAGGRVSFWLFLKAKYGYTDAQMKPYTFNFAPFLADKNLVQQGYLSSEPYALRQAGADPVTLLLADAGFDNYLCTIATSKKLAKEKKDLVQRFVTASLEGWAEYMRGGPASEPANALIKTANPDMTDDKIAYAIKVMNERGIVMSGDALTLGIGAMTDDRWSRFYGSMAEVGTLPKGVDYKKAYTLEFVNKGVGKA
jgi:NitT/TauT family transport system substrate-binding protein